MTIDWDDLVRCLVLYADDRAGLRWPADDTSQPSRENGLIWLDEEVPVWRTCTPASMGAVFDMLVEQWHRSGAPSRLDVTDRRIESMAAAYGQHAMTDDWYTCEAGNFISAVLESSEVGI